MMSFRRVGPTLLFAIAATMGFAQAGDFAPGEVLIKFRGNAMAAKTYSTFANQPIRAQTMRTLPQIGSVKVKLPPGMSVKDGVNYYKRLSYVEYAEPNHIRRPHYIPNDPRLNQQYGIDRMKVKEGWDLTKGSADVIIAIIDSGIDLNHEDLRDKLVPGYDFSDNDPDPSWEPGFGGDHGVHVSGCAAAHTDNGIGVSAPGFNSRIMPLKIFPNSFAENSAAAMIFAADNGAKVINMSYGGPGESATERNAVNYAWNAGVVLLGAAGNDGTTNRGYPAAFENVIAVGATNAQDLRAGWSTYGPDWVNVGAPGENIMSTVPGGYANATGTSMASPMAAGVVALLWAFAAPETTNAEIRQALETTTDPISNGGFINGRVNALRALEALDPGEPNVSDPVAVDLWLGASSSGSVGDLLATDQDFYSVTSADSSLGQVGGAVVDFTLTGPATNLREAQLYLEANAVTGTTGQLYLWDYTTSKYVLIKAFAVRPKVVKRERLLLPLDLTKYVSGGNIRAGIRAIGPNRAPRPWGAGPFDLLIGYARIETRERRS